MNISFIVVDEHSSSLFEEAALTFCPLSSILMVECFGMWSESFFSEMVGDGSEYSGGGYRVLAAAIDAVLMTYVSLRVMIIMSAKMAVRQLNDKKAKEENDTYHPSCHRIHDRLVMGRGPFDVLVRLEFFTLISLFLFPLFSFIVECHRQFRMMCEFNGFVVRFFSPTDVVIVVNLYFFFPDDRCVSRLWSCWPVDRSSQCRLR